MNLKKTIMMCTVQCSNEIRLTIINMGWKFGRGLGPHLPQSPLGWGLPPYQVASWCMQLFGHNRNGPKIGERGLCPFFGGRIEWGLHLTQSRLGWGLAKLPSGILIHAAQPFGRNRYGPKIGWGLCPFGGGGAGSPFKHLVTLSTYRRYTNNCIYLSIYLSIYLTQCGPGRGLPACRVSFWSVQRFGHSARTSQTGQTTVWYHRANRFTNSRPKN